MTKHLKAPSKTAVRQAMHHCLGYNYRHINEYFGVKLINIWYSINGYCATKWYNRTQEEQTLATMVANAMIRGEEYDEIIAAYTTTFYRKAAITEILADLEGI